MADNRVNVFTVKDGKWEPFGYMAVDEGVIFDNDGNSCFRYESGWLVSYKDCSLYRTDPDGRMIDIYGQVTGLIENFRNLPADAGKRIYMDYIDEFNNTALPPLKNSGDELVNSYFSIWEEDLYQADQIAEKALRSDPDNPLYVLLYATHLYFVADNADGGCRMRDATESTLIALDDVNNFCSSHLNIPEYGSIIKMINDLSYYQIGEYYYTHGFVDETEQALNNVSVDMFPYKAVLMAMNLTYCMDDEYDRLGYNSDRWENELRDVIKLLQRALLSNHWNTQNQKSTALTLIQGFLCGIYFNIKDIEYSYNSLLYAKTLKIGDTAFIDAELGKYRRDRSGELVYDAG